MTDISKYYYQEEVKNYLKNEYGNSQWIQVCGHKIIKDTDAGFWCGFIKKEYVESSLNSFSWDIAIDSGGPGFEVNGDDAIYKSCLLNDELEPLLHYREFYGVAPNYVEVSQEFILFFKARYA